jgi:tetratricopeptide (TPR) repeat protein
MSDIFISYSRKEKSFVEGLKQRLEDFELDVWVDIDGLYAGEEFWPEVTKAIDAAAVFIFVISPDSAASEFCHKEADRAASGGKRIVPLCRRQSESAELPLEVAQRQWVFFQESDESDSAMAALLSAIKADWAEIRQQARILRRAREWQEKAEDSSLLLRGKDLKESLDWRARNQGKETGATRFHDEYIDASVVTARRRRNRIAASAIAALTTIVVVSWFGVGYWIANVNNRGVIDIAAGEAAGTIADLESASRICETLGQRPGGCRHLMLVLGHAYEQLANYGASIAQCTRVLEATSEYRSGDDRILDLRGNAYQSRAFSRILLAETLPDRDERLALYRLAEDDVRQAMKTYEQTRAGIAGKPFVISEARILVGYEEYEAAIARLEVAASIEGENTYGPEIDLLYSVIHHCLGNFSMSLEYFQKFSAGFGGRFEGPRWHRSIAYYKGVKQRCQITAG